MKYFSKHNHEYSMLFNNASSGIIMRFVFVCIFAIICLAAVSLFDTNVSAQSPYESGYDHGCNDAKISDPEDRYINQPGKGPDYHTEEFMDGYYNGFDSCRDRNDDDGNDRDTNFDRFPKAHINDQGEIEIDYYILTGDDHPEDTYMDHNDDAGGIDNLQLYRNHMPGPIDDGDGEVPKDVQLDFTECNENACAEIDDSLTVFLVPDDWSDEEILNGILPESDSDIYDYMILSEFCQYLNKDCSLEFNIDRYEDGTEIDDGDYKLVINPGFDEEDLIYINEAELSTAV